MINLLQRHFIRVCLHFLMINLWWVPADDASEGLSEARAGEIVDKQVHGGTHVGEELGQSQQKVKGAGEVSASSSSTFWTHRFPEQVVIEVPAAVIAYSASNRFGNLCNISAQIRDTGRLPLRIIGQGCIEVTDIGSVVLAMVDLHRARVDVWLERSVIVP